MNFKFSKISKSDFRYFNGTNILTKSIMSQVCETEQIEKNGKKYGKYWLLQGRSKIVALAFDETNDIVKNILKANKVVTFAPETFSCKLRIKKFTSNSTCKYDMVFLSRSRFIEAAKRSSDIPNVQNTDFCSLSEVSQLLRTSQTFTSNFRSIKLNGGEVYRYLGCKVCSFSIPRKHTDGNYYCKGRCSTTNTQSRRSRLGAATERKICFTIYDVKLTDDSNQTIESIVIFNSVCESLLKKCGQDFNTDNEAVEAWKELIVSSCFDITLKRNKKKKGSAYPATIFIQTVNKVVEVASTARKESESDLDFSFDQGNAFFGNKKKNPVPEFPPKYEMKLQQPSEQHKKFVVKYKVASKPPGLVLLINNYYFPHMRDEKERIGSEIDINLIQSGFMAMGFEFYGNICHMNIKTAKEFSDLISGFKKTLIERNVDSIFVIISSHGLNYEISLTGGEKESICVVEDLMLPFSDENFPQYQGKPKVFMPITCQNLGKTAVKTSLDFQAFRLFDMLVCSPCLPGFAQRRCHQKGSLFVNWLMFNLMKYARSWHLVKILDEVQNDLKEQIQRKGVNVTVPYYYGCVFSRFYLAPKSTNWNDENEDSNPFLHMEID